MKEIESMFTEELLRLRPEYPFVIINDNKFLNDDAEKEREIVYSDIFPSIKESELVKLDDNFKIFPYDYERTMAKAKDLSWSIHGLKTNMVWSRMANIVVHNAKNIPPQLLHIIEKKFDPIVCKGEIIKNEIHVKPIDSDEFDVVFQLTDDEIRRVLNSNGIQHMTIMAQASRIIGKKVLIKTFYAENDISETPKISNYHVSANIAGIVYSGHYIYAVSMIGHPMTIRSITASMMSNKSIDIIGIPGCGAYLVPQDTKITTITNPIPNTSDVETICLTDNVARIDSDKNEVICVIKLDEESEDDFRKRIAFVVNMICDYPFLPEWIDWALKYSKQNLYSMLMHKAKTYGLFKDAMLVINDRERWNEVLKKRIEDRIVMI